ncbi:uracil-DNA glycosylase [uncultured Murdochiella sp.]|uniref:uracil-DNA glycosylase n=1 Tax=uncultured Murdochiella sp. TaxID=1586095 RepID=UPI0028065A4D|nr:uracil-DNA glycosylase [uncultured Murdochiella sp.]
MSVHIGNDWDSLLAAEWTKPYYQTLRRLLLSEYQQFTVYPPAEDIFSALRFVSYESCRVVILGQDPYHEPRQANGLAFSVHGGVPIPPSLRNIYQELDNDLGIAPVHHGDLTTWAKRGVLLLNATLTVRAHQANSHERIGWQVLTDRIIALLGQREKPLAFVLWGRYAQSKRAFITNPRHLIIESPHPSPLSAHRGFFGSCPFSRINRFYEEQGEEPIDWHLPASAEVWS